MSSEKYSPQLFDNLLFPKILQTFRMAIQPSKLTIAFSALIVICLAGWLMDICTKTVITTQNKQGQFTNSELQEYMSNPDNVRSYIKSPKQDSSDIVKHTGVFSTLWNFAAEKFQGAVDSLFAFDIPGVVANITDYFRATGWAFKYHPTYCIIFGIIKLAVIALIGGAICRLAALQLARGEKPGLTEALRFSTKKFASLFTAPLVPVVIIIIPGILIFLWGLLGNIPFFIGELIIGISMPLTLLAGALIAIFLIGTVAGFNLMFPAVAYDGSDCFDAISRSFNYIYARPWRMGFYTATAAVYGAICYTFVRFFAFLMLLSGRWFLLLGVWKNNSEGINKLVAIWPQPTFRDLADRSALAAAASLPQSTAALLIYLSVLIIIGLLVAFIISFYFSANTIIYALLRNKVDQTELDEIYTLSAETKSEDDK